MESEEASSSSDSADLENESDALNINAGWADSIAKILKTNKPKGKKTLVLSKGKKITSKKEIPKVEFEVESVNSEVKHEASTIKSENNTVPTSQQRRKKTQLPVLRVKPNILHKEREKILSKVATKGVVQLFNAIKSQQGDINKKLDEAGSLEVKRSKVLKNVDKRTFLDMLMGENLDGASTKENLKEKKIEKKEKQWNVLRDDFMMSGAKLKNWDKELEEEEEQEDMECE